MEETLQAVTWEAPEHHHQKKGGDWFWALGIIAITASIAAFFFGNFLLAILILIGAFSMALLSVQNPRIIPFSVSTRGVRIADKIYPYNTLESFYIDEEHVYGAHLLIKSKRIHLPLLILPIPEDYLHDIEDIVGSRLPEEDLEEPFAMKLLEYFGF